jgi:hypothetical protein
MPSPFGSSRSATMYYQHAGVPYHYLLNWTGMPVPGPRGAESVALGDGDYFDIQARYHKALSGLVLSDNEKRYLAIGGAALAGWLIWKHVIKKKGRRR